MIRQIMIFASVIFGFVLCNGMQLNTYKNEQIIYVPTERTEQSSECYLITPGDYVTREFLGRSQKNWLGHDTVKTEGNFLKLKQHAGRQKFGIFFMNKPTSIRNSQCSVISTMHGMWVQKKLWQQYSIEEKHKTLAYELSIDHKKRLLCHYAKLATFSSLTAGGLYGAEWFVNKHAVNKHGKQMRSTIIPIAVTILCAAKIVQKTRLPNTMFKNSLVEGDVVPLTVTEAQEVQQRADMLLQHVADD